MRFGTDEPWLDRCESPLTPPTQKGEGADRREREERGRHDGDYCYVAPRTADGYRGHDLGQRELRRAQRPQVGPCVRQRLRPLADSSLASRLLLSRRDARTRGTALPFGNLARNSR